MVHAKESLLIFEDEIEFLKEQLKTHTIRTANSRQAPQNPLRPGKEITYDPTGAFVLPNPLTGISLAASFKQLERIYKPGMKKWLLLVDRNCLMPDGLKLQPDSPDHWSIVVTRKMPVDEFNRKIEEMIKSWSNIGQFVRYE